MPLPSALTQYMGITDTHDVSSVSIDPMQPFSIGTDIVKLRPNSHKFLNMVMKRARTKTTDTNKFSHPEIGPGKHWVTYVGADETTGTTQIITGLSITGIDHVAAAYYKLYNPRTDEMMLLTADCTADTTGAVTRNFGTPGADATGPFLKNGDKLLVIGTNKMEGGTMTKGNRTDPIWKWFDTGIIDHPIQMTGTAAANRNVGGDKFANAMAEAIEKSQAQLEYELVFGRIVQDNTNFTYAMHTMQGLMGFVDTNVFDINGYPSQGDIEDILAQWDVFLKGDGGYVVCSKAFIRLINNFALGQLQYDQAMKALGIDIAQITIPGSGTFSLVEWPLLNEEPNLQGMLIGIPNPGPDGLPSIDYRPLVYNGENRDIGYFPVGTLPIQRNSTDLKQGHIFGEVGFEYFLEERFFIATGIQF